MKWHLTESRGDSDHTDELPVLSEEAVLELESGLVAADSAADDPLESSVDALRDALDVAEQRSAALEDDMSAGDEIRDGDSDHSLLERIASLETYIAGRADRWQAMEQELNARSRRITELEIELEQRIEREQRLEDRLHNENDRSNQLRDKLRRMHRRLEELEFDSINQDLDPTRDLVDRAMETDRVRFRHDQIMPRSDFGRAPRILCLNPDLPDPFVILKDSITIGRAPDCDIQIATDFVSRRHATIRRDKSSTIIEDRSSTNGVFVNSVRVDRKTLMDGDEFTIGESRFRFVAGEPLPEIH